MTLRKGGWGKRPFSFLSRKLKTTPKPTLLCETLDYRYCETLHDQIKISPKNHQFTHRIYFEEIVGRKKKIFVIAKSSFIIFCIGNGRLIEIGNYEKTSFSSLNSQNWRRNNLWKVTLKLDNYLKFLIKKWSTLSRFIYF